MFMNCARRKRILSLFLSLAPSQRCSFHLNDLNIIIIYHGKLIMLIPKDMGKGKMENDTKKDVACKLKDFGFYFILPCPEANIHTRGW